MLGSGRLVLTGQQNTAPTVFTLGQAEAGRTAYQNACGKCHTYTLLGRKGEEGELPPVASLSAPYQKFIGTPNHVPPLAGKSFSAVGARKPQPNSSPGFKSPRVIRFSNLRGWIRTPS